LLPSTVTAVQVLLLASLAAFIAASALPTDDSWDGTMFSVYSNFSFSSVVPASPKHMLAFFVAANSGGAQLDSLTFRLNRFGTRQRGAQHLS